MRLLFGKGADVAVEDAERLTAGMVLEWNVEEERSE
jgi:hypothetical protein